MKTFAIVTGCLALAIPSVSMAMPNPAAVFCEHSGGRVVNATLRDGSEIGLCYLPDRKIIEEWTLFRMSRPDGQPPVAGRSR